MIKKFFRFVYGGLIYLFYVFFVGEVEVVGDIVFL